MKERSKNRVKKAVSKKACDFLNSLAYTSCSSYSFVGPYGQLSAVHHLITHLDKTYTYLED